MPLTSRLVEDFQLLHLAKFGDVISYEDAAQALNELALLVRITSPKEETKNDYAVNTEGS